MKCEKGQKDLTFHGSTCSFIVCKCHKSVIISVTKQYNQSNTQVYNTQEWDRQQNNLCRGQTLLKFVYRDNRANGSTFPHRRSTPLTFWSRLPIIQGYTCFTSPTSIHWCLRWHTSCHWLEVPAGSSTENLASTGGRRYGSTHQFLSIHNPEPLVVEITTTLSQSSVAVSEYRK